ncbi:MAG TPA: DUF5309 family protein [Gemmatimonadaceae bacterium]|nr:DUF5309 family protein [Gemmatimonadaceae bacterium]
MPAVAAAVATSFDLPNYVGELFFQKSERPNTLLRLIGGMTSGVRTVGAPKFPLSVDYQLPAPAQPAILEGADPVLREEDTEQSTNILQIFQEGVGLTYTRESSQAAIGGLAVIPGGGEGEVVRPGSFEWQVQRAIERIQNQYNFSALRGAYNEPADNTGARGMRGVLSACVTNVKDNAAAVLSKAVINDTLQAWMESRMFNRGDQLFVLASADDMTKLLALYEGDAQPPRAVDTVGVTVQYINTRWAQLNVAWEPDMPAGQLLFTQPSRIQPVAMPIVAGGQNKGLLFREEVAHTGSSRTQQLYGEWGIDYAHEIFHGTLKNYT